MNAGKSLQLLSVNHNYEENGENVILFTSAKDDRYGIGYVTSRVGIKKPAIMVNDHTNLYNIIKEKNKDLEIKSVLVDEVQFFSKEQIFQLSDIVDILNIPVIAYGLRSDFKMEPFEGSKYIMAISDSIEEIKTICGVCKNKKAIINVRIDKVGNPVTEGDQVEIGGNDKYKSMCRKCYKKSI